MLTENAEMNHRNELELACTQGLSERISFDVQTCLIYITRVTIVIKIQVSTENMNVVNSKL